ncbi:hypothetical protein ACRBEV_25455 [Methylobacterium phyllosphaerae]
MDAIEGDQGLPQHGGVGQGDQISMLKVERRFAARPTCSEVRGCFATFVGSGREILLTVRRA